MVFSVTVLGSSSALPTSKRFPSACALNVHERFFLVDCGEGTQIQIRKYRIKLSKINHIFISHLHGDHFFGLFGLISSFNLIGRNADLWIYAHRDIKRILNSHFKYFDQNRDYNIKYRFLNYEKEELIYEDKNMYVKSIPLKHRIPTCGFLFEEKKRPNHIIKDKIEEYKIPVKNIPDIKNGEDFFTEEGVKISNSELTFPSYKPRKFAYCSDTAYDESIIKSIKDIDLLWHEATFLNDQKSRVKETFHSTAEQAAQIAKAGNVGNLILSHFSSRYKDLSKFKEESGRIFENVYLAKEGKEFIIDTNGNLTMTCKEPLPDMTCSDD